MVAFVALLFTALPTTAQPIPMPCPEQTEWRGECAVLDSASRAGVLRAARAHIVAGDACVALFDTLTALLTAPVWRFDVWRYERHANDEGDVFVGAQTIRRPDRDRASLGLSARAWTNSETLARIAIHEAAHMLLDVGDELGAQRLERQCAITPESGVRP